MKAILLRVAPRGFCLSLSVLVLIALALAVAPAPAVRAASVTVDSTMDGLHPSGCATNGTSPCSLRDAVTYANAHTGTAITVPIGTYNLTIDALNLTNDMMITGAGAGSTILNGSALSVSAFNATGGNVTLAGMTIRNGNSGDDGGAIAASGPALTINASVISGNTGQNGGAIFVGSTTTLTVNDSTISGNTATGTGGGIRNNGITFLNRSTISENHSSGGSGGGIFNNSGSLTLTNSTVSGNLSGNQGGGFLTLSTVSLVNSTIANNTLSSGASSAFYTNSQVTLQNSIIAGSCISSGSIVSHDYNISTDGSCGLTASNDLPNTNPNLGALHNNGGPTFTHALPVGSMAIDRIPSAGGCNGAGVATDQRGIARPQPIGGNCDVGAYEYQGAAATKFTVSGFPSSTAAGTPGDVTVTAQDDNGVTTPTYSGTVHFTSSDGQSVAGAGLPRDYMFLSSDNGVHIFTSGVTLKTAGTQRITATDTTTATIAGTEANITITPSTATTLTVSGFPSSQTAGVPADITVTAMDGFNNVATGYAGTIHFTSSDPQAIAGTGLPANYQFVAGAGTHTFTNGITLKTAGAATITATDTGTGSITGTQSGITINPAAATQLIVTGFPSSTTAGVAGSVTVAVKDSFNNTITGYGGTIRFTSSDPQVALPGDYTFGSGDMGVHLFPGGVTLKTAGAQSVIATDGSSLTGSQSNIRVVAADATSLIVGGYPSPTQVNASNGYIVFAKDTFGNTVPTYTGTVHFSSMDGNAILPANYTFTGVDAGTRVFTATMKTVGTQTLTATDTGTSAITGTQTGIVVNPAAGTHLTLSAPTTAKAGTAFSVTVTAKDALENRVTDYTRTVRFTSSDPLAGLPPDYTFVAADSGAHVFTVLLKTAGSRTVTATDLSVSAVTGSATVMVSGPVITGVTPLSGPFSSGTAITVTGINLTGASVTIGGNACTGVVVNGGGTSLICNAPPHAAGTVEVIVTTSSGAATLNSAFTYLPASLPPAPPSRTGGGGGTGGSPAPAPAHR